MALGGLFDLLDVGAVIPYAIAPTSGKWLPYEGGTYNVDDYPDLGAALGGSPGGTFTLPDFRGRAVYAADGTNPAGHIDGTNVRDFTHSHGTGTIVTQSAGAHTHGGSTGGPSSVISRGPNQLFGNEDVGDAAHTHSISSDGAHTHTLTGTTSTELSSVNIRPARGYLRLYIKALP